MDHSSVGPRGYSEKRRRHRGGEGYSAGNSEVNEAFNLFKERDADGALKMLKKACAKHPEISPAHVILARFFRQANAAPGMRNALEQGVKELPDDPEAYLFMADLAMQDGRTTEARLLYEKADSLMSKFDVAARKKNLEIQVLAGLAATSEAREDWTGAQRRVEAWLQLDPKSIAALREMSGCLLRQKNVTGALEYLVKAYKLAEAKAKEEHKEVDMLPPEATVAQFFWQTGDQDNAKKWMIVMLQQHPRKINVRLLATRWALATEQLVEAEKQANAVLQLSPQSLDGLILRGVIARFQKNYKAAEGYCQQAVLLARRIPSSPPIISPWPWSSKAATTRRNGRYSTPKTTLASIRKRIKGPKPFRPTVGCFTSWTGLRMRKKPSAPPFRAEATAPIRHTISPRSSPSVADIPRTPSTCSKVR